MEEKSNLTAERSLEIITEQLERSRQTVARHTGQTLYISGLCLMGWALLIGLCICFTKNAAFYLLYILLPLVITSLTAMSIETNLKSQTVLSAAW